MTAQIEIKGIKACVFDAYGTLFDVHSAVGKYRQRMKGLADQVSALWRTKQLEYTWLRSLMGCHADFWQITQDALDFAFDMYDFKDQGLRHDLIEAYLHLDCYPEVPAVLSELRKRGYRIAILSNGTPEMLAAAVHHSGLAPLIEQTYSVEQIGVFKPDPRVYQIGVDGLGVTAQQTLFMSSNAWDASGAAHFGFKVAWINRFGQSAERLPGRPDIELSSLAELPELISRA